MCGEPLPKNKQKYCSYECAGEAKTEKASRAKVIKCAVCTKSFINDKVGGIKKYCSDVCKKKGINKQRRQSDWYQKKYPTIERGCLWCYRRFIAIRSDQIYCKQQCTRAMVRKRKTKSTNIKNRSGKRCIYCGDLVKLQRHLACKECSEGKEKQNGNRLWKELGK